MATSLFVTGGTGFLGGRILELAIEQGALATALVRRPEIHSPVGDADAVRVVHGDLRDPASYAAGLASHATVIHAATTCPGWGSYADLRAESARQVRGLIDATVKAGVKRLVLVSSATVYGPGLRGEVTEDRPARLHGDLCGDAHADAEAIAREAAARLEVVIVRPALCYGGSDTRFLPRLFLDLVTGRSRVVGDGGGRLLVCDVHRLADLVLKAATLPGAAGQTFHAVDASQPTWGEALRRVHAELQATAPLKSVPGWLARAAAAVSESAARLTGAQEPALTRHVVELVTAHHTLSTERARTVLGHEPRSDSLTEIVRHARVWRSTNRLATDGV